MAIHRACYYLDLARDMEQEGGMAIWRFNPVRVRNGESTMVMRVVRDAMLKWIRREESAQIIVPLSLIPPARLQAGPVRNSVCGAILTGDIWPKDDAGPQAVARALIRRY
jgi:hypothetical protein